MVMVEETAYTIQIIRYLVGQNVHMIKRWPISLATGRQIRRGQKWIKTMVQLPPTQEMYRLSLVDNLEAFKIMERLKTLI
jgi:hypothetical protein